MNTTNNKKSLYFILGIIFFIAITLNLIIQSSFNYINNKKQLENELLNDINVSSLQLQNSIIPLIESYHVIEYENLIKNEMYHENLLAIVVKDYKMGKIIGNDVYITGIIKNEKRELKAFYSMNDKISKQLKEAFSTKKLDLVNKNKEHVATLTIYGTNCFISKKLNDIIIKNVLISIAIYIVVFFILYIVVKQILIDPINKIVNSLAYRKDGHIIFKQIDVHNSQELSFLSTSINNMTSQILESNKELEESNRRWQFSIEGSGDGLWDWDLKTNKVFFSNKLKEMLGYKPNELKGTYEEWEERVHPDDLSKACKDIEKHLSGETPIYSNEHRMRCKNGSYKWVYVRGIIVDRDENNEATRLIGTQTDIDDKKEYESQMKQAYSVYENTNEGIMITNANNKIINVNPAFCRTTGYTKNEVIGQNPSILKSYTHEKIFYDNMWGIIKEKGFWQGEVTNKRKDGKLYEEYISINAIKDENGNVENYIGIFSDISIVKEQEKMILEQSRTSAIGEMIGNIAHQWRQPLSTISTASTGMKLQLEMGLEVEKEQSIETLNKINKQTQHLSKTIDDFRSFFTEDLSEISEFEVSKTIKKVDELIIDSFTNNFVEINYDIQKDIYIEGNKNLLIQALLNIYNNALDALKNINDNRVIFVSFEKVGPKTVLKIKDNGGGIKKKYLDKIFDPYFTTKHQSQGTGIGLYMTHQIIQKQFQGSITVKNNSFFYKNKNYIGAEFTIII